jgi:hypothetical protein
VPSALPQARHARHDPGQTIDESSKAAPMLALYHTSSGMQLTRPYSSILPTGQRISTMAAVGDIWQLIVSPDFLSVPFASSAVRVSIDLVIPRPDEGSFMSYHDDWYYLWFSYGICCGFNASDLPSSGQEYSICVGRSQSARGQFVDMNGNALDNVGGYIVYALGEQGVLTCEGGERDVVYYHYRKF